MRNLGYAYEYKTIRKLLNGEVIEFEGLKLKMLGEGMVRNGDLYIAERNSIQFLTCDYVDEKEGLIISVPKAYPFDINECVAVEEV